MAGTETTVYLPLRCFKERNRKGVLEPSSNAASY